MMSKFINPFSETTTNNLLMIGVLAMILAGIQSYWLGYIPDGVFQLHIMNISHWYFGVFNGIINILLPSMVLFVIGRIFNPRTRFVDVLVTLLVAQIVNYLSALILFNPYTKSKLLSISTAIMSGDLKMEMVPRGDLIISGIAGIVAFSLLLYFFYLVVVGMKIATNRRKIGFSISCILIPIMLDFCLKVLNPYFY